MFVSFLFRQQSICALGWSACRLAVFLIAVTIASIAHAAPLKSSFQSFDVPPSPRGIALVDLNHDDRLDVVVGHDQGSAVSVLIGRGDGTFYSRPDALHAQNPCRDVAVADFNGDGNLDLVATSSPMVIALGDASGQFGDTAVVDIGPGNARRVLAVDLDADGHLDLAACDGSRNGLVVVQGNGDGTFGEATLYQVGQDPYSLSSADLNSDGRPDLVVVAYNGRTASIFLTNQDGSLIPQPDVSLGANPQDVAIGDLNADGHPDLAITTDFGPTGPAVQMYAGQGDGTFLALAQVPCENFAQAVALADFDHDGALDLLTTDIGPMLVSLRRGLGDGTFGPIQNYVAGWNPYRMAIGDLNSDGIVDVAVACDISDNVCVFRGNSNVSLGEGETLPVTYPTQCVLLADLDTDGDLDALLGQRSGVTVLRNDGLGHFEIPGDHHFAGDQAMVVGDFDGDKLPDVVAAYAEHGRVAFLHGRGDATLDPAVDIDVGLQPRGITSGDFDGDGARDLAVSLLTGDSILVLRGHGDGSFAPGIGIAGIPQPRGILAADFNHDGRLDLAVASDSIEGSINVLLGSGDGTFGPSASFSAGNYTYAIVSADFDGDGNLDLAWVSDSNLSAWIALGRGDGTFRNPDNRSRVGRVPRSIAVGDLDRDGIPDLVVGAELANTASILLGRGDGSFRDRIDLCGGSGVSGVAIGDIDGDHWPDVVTSAHWGQYGLPMVLRSRGAALLPVALPATAHITLIALQVMSPVRDRIRWSVSSREHREANINLLDVSGRRIATVYHGSLSSVPTSNSWVPESHGLRLHSGVYFLRAEAGTASTQAKLVWLE